MCFFEAAGVSKYRENIVKERLVYIKYLMDNTSNKKDTTQLERMYNTLYNCNYDINGKLRSLQSMFTYINQTMTENKGIIPGLPTEEQIENLDGKASTFKNLHKQDFEAYLTKFEKSNLDKAGTKKDDEANDILSPENPDDNEKALKSIREISSIFGLTNILGLEPKRKPSDNDLKHQAELKKQQADGNPNASPEDDQDKKDANKDAATVAGGEEPQEPQQAGGEGGGDDTQNELHTYAQTIIDDYMDNTDQEEYNEEDVDNYLGDLSESGLGEDELKNVVKLIKDGIRKNFKAKKSTKESFGMKNLSDYLLECLS